MPSSEILVGVATLTHIVAFVMYNRQLLKGKSKPNIISWLIWAFITILNFTSYNVMSGDWLKSLLPTVSSMLCVLTFVLTFFTGRFARVSWADMLALALGLFAAGLWHLLNSATYANLILQASIAIGFLPTFRSVWERPNNEPPIPWFVWCAAFSLGLIVVLLRWQGQYQDLVYYLNCLVLHLAIAVLSLRITTA